MEELGEVHVNNKNKETFSFFNGTTPRFIQEIKSTGNFFNDKTLIHGKVLDGYTIYVVITKDWKRQFQTRMAGKSYRENVVLYLTELIRYHVPNSKNCSQN